MTTYLPVVALHGTDNRLCNLQGKLLQLISSLLSRSLSHPLLHNLILVLAAKALYRVRVQLRRGRRLGQLVLRPGDIIPGRRGRGRGLLMILILLCLRRPRRSWGSTLACRDSGRKSELLKWADVVLRWGRGGGGLQLAPLHRGSLGGWGLLRGGRHGCLPLRGVDAANAFLPGRSRWRTAASRVLFGGLVPALCQLWAASRWRAPLAPPELAGDIGEATLAAWNPGPRLTSACLGSSSLEATCPLHDVPRPWARSAQPPAVGGVPPPLLDLHLQGLGRRPGLVLWRGRRILHPSHGLINACHVAVGRRYPGLALEEVVVVMHAIGPVLMRGWDLVRINIGPDHLLEVGRLHRRTSGAATGLHRGRRLRRLLVFASRRLIKKKMWYLGDTLQNACKYRFIFRRTRTRTRTVFVFPIIWGWGCLLGLSFTDTGSIVLPSCKS